MPFMWSLWFCRCVQTTAAVLLAGTAALSLLAWGTECEPARRIWRRLAWASGGMLLAMGLFVLGLEAAEMSGQPLAGVMASGAVAEVLGGTRFGTVWCGRMGVLAGWFVVAGVAAGWRDAKTDAGCGMRDELGEVVLSNERDHWHSKAVPSSYQRCQVLDVGGAVLAFVLLGSLVLAGHAEASEKSAWLLPVNVCHALAAGAWPGGLVPLATLLGQARRDAALVPAAVVIVRRFSRLSVAAVGVLAFSGVLNGVGMVGTVAALATSTYGRLVVGKAALFAVMIGLGGVNRRLIRREEETDPEQTLRRLRRNVALECALAAGVLLASEALALSAPPLTTSAGP